MKQTLDIDPTLAARISELDQAAGLAGKTSIATILLGDWLGDAMRNPDQHQDFSGLLDNVAFRSAKDKRAALAAWRRLARRWAAEDAGQLVTV